MKDDSCFRACKPAAGRPRLVRPRGEPAPSASDGPILVPFAAPPGWVGSRILLPFAALHVGLVPWNFLRPAHRPATAES